MLRRFTGLVAALPYLVGCGAADDKPAPEPPPVEPEPTPEEGCRHGELTLEDGSCRPAGILADECGEGFEHDGDLGCAAILPDAPCPPGTMAIPGETVCREVAPCGEGAWGDIPRDAQTQHVDGSYVANDSDGSEGQPWTTVQAAVDAAAPGAIVAIAAGNYVAPVVIEGKAVRLWGKCPAEVGLVGAVGDTWVVEVRTGGDGSEIRDLRVGGQGFAVTIDGAQDVVADRLWIDNAGLPGFTVGDQAGPASAELTRSLIEAAGDLGVYVIGAELSMSESVVRDTVQLQPDFGRGVSMAADAVTARRSNVTIERSVITGNPELGVYASGSSVTIRDSMVGHTSPTGFGGHAVGAWRQLDTGDPAVAVVEGSVLEQTSTSAVHVVDSDLSIDRTTIRDVAPSTNLLDGAGLIALRADHPEPTSAVVTRSLVERASFCGLCIAGMEAEVESVVTRDITPQAADGAFGRGISLEGSLAGPTPIAGAGRLTASVVERVHETGVALVFADVDIASLAVRDVAPSFDGTRGRGLNIELDPAAGPSHVRADGVTIERSHEFGIYVSGSQATIADAVVQDILARPADGAGGVGIAVQFSIELGTPAQATVTDSVARRCQQSALSLIGASATFERVVTDEVLPDGNGKFGDGLLVSGAIFDDVITPGTATVIDSRFEGSARAGLLSFAAETTVSGTTFECNAIHLNGESFEGVAFAIHNGGGNTCGCDGEEVLCKTLRSGLEVPGAIE